MVTMYAIAMSMIIMITMKIMHTMMKKLTSMKQSKTSFECGFSTKKSPEIPFSIQFFMVSVMFIIFDIEISMLLSMLTAMMKFPMKKWAKSSMMFMLMMQATLIYEMMKSSMKWMK